MNSEEMMYKVIANVQKDMESNIEEFAKRQQQEAKRVLIKMDQFLDELEACENVQDSKPLLRKVLAAVLSYEGNFDRQADSVAEYLMNALLQDNIQPDYVVKMLRGAWKDMKTYVLKN